jgi:hypothetical protein
MKSAKLTFIKLELLISTHNCFKDIVFWSQPKIGLNNCWKWKLFWWYRNGYKVENSIWAKFGQSSFSQVLSPLNILGILQAIKVFDKSNFSEVLLIFIDQDLTIKLLICYQDNFWGSFFSKTALILDCFNDLNFRKCLGGAPLNLQNPR